MPAYFPFDPNPRVPTVTLPPLACDSQFHVFGPAEKYPVRPGAAYEMPSATVAAALHMHRTLGLQRGVIVQPTTYGADHSATLDGIAAAGPNYRGCANAAVFDERGRCVSRQAARRRHPRRALLAPVARHRADAGGLRARDRAHPRAWLVRQGAARARGLRRAGGAIREARSAGADRPHGPAEPGGGQGRSVAEESAGASQARQFLGDAVARRRRSRKPARRGTM